MVKQEQRKCRYPGAQKSYFQKGAPGNARWTAGPAQPCLLGTGQYLWECGTGKFATGARVILVYFSIKEALCLTSAGIMYEWKMM